MEKLKVFISYSTEDDPQRLKLLEKMINNSNNFEAVIIPSKKGLDEDFGIKISKGLKSAQFFVPIITEKSFESLWLNQEIGYARAMQDKGLIKIIPIVEEKLFTKKKFNYKGFIHKFREVELFSSDKKGNNFKKAIKGIIERLDEQYNSGLTMKYRIRSIFYRNYLKWSIGSSTGSPIFLNTVNFTLENIGEKNLVIKELEMIIYNEKLRGLFSQNQSNNMSFILQEYYDSTNKNVRITNKYILLKPEEPLQLKCFWSSAELIIGDMPLYLKVFKENNDKIFNINLKITLHNNETFEIPSDITDEVHYIASVVPDNEV